MSGAAAIRKSIRFRGRSFLAFVLEPEPPLSDWLVHLDDTLNRSVGFFRGRPIVLDVSRLSLTREGLRGLLDDLQGRDIRVLGVEGADPSLLEAGFPPALAGGRPASLSGQPDGRSSGREKPERAPKSSLLVDQPVRSGQSIVFLHGDVTVIGSVGSGAEVVAGGSIHIYGALRGRALAGAKGNPGARLFCTRGEPELLAIDCVYMTADEVDPQLRGKPMQVWLDGGTIRIAALD